MKFKVQKFNKKYEYARLDNKHDIEVRSISNAAYADIN